ncbi:MAG: hypothetical protein RI907_2584 [Pseudomonadota bacterium]|jgi:ComF family protein
MAWPQADGASPALGLAECLQCEAQAPEFDRAVVAVHYAAPWSQLIARLKFQRRSALAPAMGRLLAQAAQVSAAASPAGWPDVVLPVPLSAQRLQERGFNQSWLLARACATELGLRCRHDVLLRTRHTSRLMQMSAPDRALALDQAFAVAPAQSHWVLGAHVALVDDVLTTGATLDAASRALRDAGARSVSAWVLARTGLGP